MMAQSRNFKETMNKNGSDKFLWFAVFIIIVAGLVANYYFSAQLLVIRFIGWLVIAGVAVAIASQTAKGRQAWEFLREARVELRKVVWPSRQETIQTTLALLAVITIMSLILWGVDSFLMWVVSFFTG